MMSNYQINVVKIDARRQEHFNNNLTADKRAPTTPTKNQQYKQFEQGKDFVDLCIISDIAHTMMI